MSLRRYLPVVVLCIGAVAGCGSSDDRDAASPPLTPTEVFCLAVGATAEGCEAPSPTPTLAPCTAAALTSCSVCSTLGGCCTLTTPNACFDPSVPPLGMNGIGFTLCASDQAAACLIGSTPTPSGTTPAPTVTPASSAVPTATPSPTLVAPPITPGMVTFVNSCAVSLTLRSSGLPLGTLAATGDQVSVAVSSFNQASQNVVMPYPNLTTVQCPNDYCDGWTDLGGTPGTTQREGFMWEGDNVTYAAYCNPNLSGRGICAAQQKCCGPNMVQDGTFGTTWEFTPNGANALDYPDLSTNYGSGPHSPPHLCPYPENPNDCVSAAANIFFNVPIRWTSNMLCSCTSAGTQVTSRECLTVSCPDAYQHPTDDKQCACSSSSARGYYVEFCPAGSPLPATPG